MKSRVEHLCVRCGFPARRGALPIILGDKLYCSVACVERCEPGGTPGRFPEPLRSMHLAVESGESPYAESA